MPWPTFPARLGTATPHVLENDTIATLVRETMARTRPQHAAMVVGQTTAETLGLLVLLQAAVATELAHLGVSNTTTQAAGAGRIELTTAAEAACAAAAAALPQAP